MEYLKFPHSFADYRSKKQVENYDLAEKSILTGSKSQYNSKALARICEHLGMSLSELKSKMCDDPLFSRLMGFSAAINASRQGTSLESEIIKLISDSVSRFGIELWNLPVNEQVPVKGSGEILSRADAKKTFGKKEYKNKILKSFDFCGKIEHKKYKNILGFAKVCVGAGGHQDNVRIEAQDYIAWATEYGKGDTIYIVLYDTDDKQDDFQLLRALEKGIRIK